MMGPCGELFGSSAKGEDDRAFVERVLKIDQAERPTADTLLQDDWFADYKS